MILRIGIIVWAVFLLLTGCAAEKPIERIPLPQETAETYFNRAVDYSQKGEYKKAIPDYNKDIEINPDFVKAIEVDPKYASAYYYRGHIYHYNGEYEKAWEDIKKARSLGYKVPSEFLKNLKEAYEKQKGISPN